jgi:hypothetical protein
MKRQRSIMLSILLLLLLAASASAGIQPKHLSEVPRITPADLQQLHTNQAVTIIDTRTAGQWHRDKQKVQGAVRFTFSDDIEALKDRIPLDQTIVTYCS